MSVTRIRMAEDGPEFSRIAHGYWKVENWGLNDEELYKTFNETLELGITTYDHADIYGGFANEEIFGRILSKNPSVRDKIEIVTKCGIVFNCPNRPEYKFHYYDSSKEHIIQSVENSLKNFQTDYIDLLLLHRPDILIDPDEVADAFVRLRESGKVKNFGVSNFTNSQFELLQSRLFFRLVTNQIKISVIHPEPMEDGSVDLCMKNRISPMAYSPLGEGKLFNSENENIRNVRDELARIGQEFNAGVDQMALAWLLKHPAGIVPILGSGKIERIKAAVKAESIPLSREEWYRILAKFQGREVL